MPGSRRHGVQSAFTAAACVIFAAGCGEEPLERRVNDACRDHGGTRSYSFPLAICNDGRAVKP